MISNKAEIIGSVVTVLFIGSQKGIKSRMDSFPTAVFHLLKQQVIVIVKANIDAITM